MTASPTTAACAPRARRAVATWARRPRAASASAATACRRASPARAAWAATGARARAAGCPRRRRATISTTTATASPTTAAPAAAARRAPVTTARTATAGVGICRAGTQALRDRAGVARWGTCQDRCCPSPPGETCNGVDDDCDGIVDGMTRRAAATSAIAARTETCKAGAWGACVGGVGPGVEDCNGGDENCDGVIDEGCDCRDGTTRALRSRSCRRMPPRDADLRDRTLGRLRGRASIPRREICRQHRRRLRRHHRQRLRLHRGRHALVLQRARGHVGRGARASPGTQMCRRRGRRGGVGAPAWARCCPRPRPATARTTTATDSPTTACRRRCRWSTPRAQNRNADILFMIDDSLSMDPNQASLIRELPGPDEHAARVPGRAAQPARRGGDVGSRRRPGDRRTAAASPGGDGGVFRDAPPANCMGPHRIVHRRVEQRGDEELPGHHRAGVRLPRERRTPRLRLRAPARVGGGRARLPGDGAGGEHRASCGPTRSSPSPSSPTRTTARRRRTRRSSTRRRCPAERHARAARSFRCNEFGHLCGGVAPAAQRHRVGDDHLADCHSNEAGLLYPVGTFAASSRRSSPIRRCCSSRPSLRRSTPYTIDYRPNPVQHRRESRRSSPHSCTRSDGAFRGIRRCGCPISSRVRRERQPQQHLRRLVRARAVRSSARRSGARSRRTALTRTSRTAIAAAPGIQATLRRRAARAGKPRSDSTGVRHGDAAGRAAALLVSDGEHAAAARGVLFSMNRTGATTAGETISVRCDTCR